MTTLSNQEAKNNLTSSTNGKSNKRKQFQKPVMVLAMAITLSACGGTSDKIIDHIDTNNSTNVSYINALAHNTTFYLKSSIYNASVYESRFRTVELMSADVSEVITHDWIDGANESVFAMENSITNGSRVSQNFDINKESDYWAIAWNEIDENKLSVFEKKTNNKADVYSVRLLATSEMSVKTFLSNDILATTESGVVTAFFEIEGCSDLMVGDNEIDLCSIGTVGQSYLAVVSIDGQIVVVQE